MIEDFVAAAAAAVAARAGAGAAFSFVDDDACSAYWEFSSTTTLPPWTKCQGQTPLVVVFATTNGRYVYGHGFCFVVVARPPTKFFHSVLRRSESEVIAVRSTAHYLACVFRAI